MTTMRIATFLLVATIASSEALAKIPKHSNAMIECTSNFDCAHGYCCTISNERYSYPRCQKLHEVGDYCRSDGPLLTNGSSRSYPHGLELHLDEVYLLFCPCAPGLVCDSDERVCRQPSDMKDFNYLKEEETGSNKSDD